MTINKIRRILTGKVGFKDNSIQTIEKQGFIKNKLLHIFIKSEVKADKK